MLWYKRQKYGLKSWLVKEVGHGISHKCIITINFSRHNCVKRSFRAEKVKEILSVNRRQFNVVRILEACWLSCQLSYHTLTSCFCLSASSWRLSCQCKNFPRSLPNEFFFFLLWALSGNLIHGFSYDLCVQGPQISISITDHFFLSTDLNFQLLFPIGCPRDTSNPIHPKQNLLFLPFCQAYFYCWILCPCKRQRHRPKQHKSSRPRRCRRRYLPAIRTLIPMGFYLCCSLIRNAFHLDFPRSRSKACSFVRSA